MRRNRCPGLTWDVDDHVAAELDADDGCHGSEGRAVDEAGVGARRQVGRHLERPWRVRPELEHVQPARALPPEALCAHSDAAKSQTERVNNNHFWPPFPASCAKRGYNFLLFDGRVAGHLGDAVGLKTLSIHVCVCPHFGM